ncbi:uncharacterized protein LOC110726928 isoform X2 [Chenopodium quinoa]|uniref:uncharacterized protein LOC110726928 isoform X2 n=1 Tax=Chenopodium quinoa TaxID=63459 RepID=UPI000B77BB31|nr:uncharacterized protein LOC110726928 isoform X2 [Chenopodium quinoa]
MAGDTSASTFTSVTDAPFSGLVICVSGLSKEARKQVMEATERLGGKYSPNLHPNCTHLLVQSLEGHKFEHALNHTHLFVVTLGWFIDSVNNHVKLDELPYTVCSIPRDRDACVSISQNQNQNRNQFRHNQLHSGSGDINKVSHLFGHSIYIDLGVSAQLRCKVVDVATREGAVLVDQWFVGCGASYVVCEGSSIQIYLGHCDNIISPMWVLKTSKERSMQRFVGLSADLARYVGAMLENLQQVTARQSCQVPLRPINPSSLLDSICWSISEPTSRASVYADSLTSKNDFEMQKYGLSVGGDHVESEASFSNLLRPLTESEENELVFKNHFLTILYPVDRFAELGPSSRTYFSDTGFTCLQLLEFIYAFYQENMSDRETEVAIHTDSRHADHLRSIYSNERTADLGCMMYKRIEFLGSRKSFEMLKRVSGDNNSNVYELLIRE